MKSIVVAVTVLVILGSFAWPQMPQTTDYQGKPVIHGRTFVDSTIGTKLRVYPDSIMPEFLPGETRDSGDTTNAQPSSMVTLTDSDGNGFEDQYEQELAEKFCPSLILHSGDQGVSPEPVEIANQVIWASNYGYLDWEYYGELPTVWAEGDYSSLDSWDMYLNWVAWAEPPCGDYWVYHPLPHFDYAGPGPEYHCLERISGAYYDQPPGWYDAYADGNAHVSRGSSFDHTVYAHLFTHGGEYIIQYWFFYPFNDFVNDHEGDWEHINVVITSQDPAVAQIDRVIYIFHHYYWTAYDTQEENPAEFDCYVIDGAHPVVFVGGHGAEDHLGSHGEGHGSHGSYPIYGLWDAVSPMDWFGIIPEIDEHVDGEGRFIPYRHIIDDDTSDNDGVVIIRGVEDYDYNVNPEMSWLAAKILWGYPYVHSFCTNLEWYPPGVDPTNVGNQAPGGPAHNDGWEVVDSAVGEANGHSGLKWYPWYPPYFPVSDAGWSPPIWFENAHRYAAGDYPISVFPGDLDGDGDLDLAIANYFSHGVSVLENNGNGAFQTKAEYITGNNPISVSCADLDGDSDMDLAVVNSGGANSVSILRNDGNGGFPAIDHYAVGSGPRSVFCADIDGDSDLDLIVANEGGNLSILKNHGNGTFEDALACEAGNAPVSVFAADLDADADLDLAVANTGFASTVSILKNNGGGGFSIDADYRVGDGAWSVFCTDLDGDSDLDLAVANSLSDDLSILKNNGDGTFQGAATVWAGDDPYSVFCADLDGDSDYDLAVANHGSDDVFVLENDGNGNFGRAFNHAAGDGPASVFCADLDGDSDLDLAVASSGCDSVAILKDTTQIPVNEAPYPFSLHSPTDGDSVPGPVAFDWQTPYDPNFGDQIRYDLWVSTDPAFAPESTTVHDSLGISKFTETLNLGIYYWKVRAYDNWNAERWSTQTWVFHCPESLDSIPFALPVHYSVSSFASCVFSADFDGDSALDLAVTNERWIGSVSILKNNGYGEFLSKEDFATGAFPMSIFSADLDADGDKDLAVAGGEYDPTISILKNDGEGRFLERDDYDACSRPWSVFCANLDGDSAVDLAVANYGGGNVSIFKNNGDGTFRDTVNYVTGGWPTSVFCADLDGDGHTDLAVAVDPACISIFRNYGDGTFQDPVNYPLGEDYTPHSLFCADLDGDSAVDIAVANGWGSNVSILKNDGNGRFQGPIVYDLIECPFAVFCADIDNDGDFDLVLDGGSEDIAVLKNNGSGSFHSEFHYAAGSSPWSLFCADLDGDTDVDIVTGNYNGHDVSVLKNLTEAPDNHPPQPFSLLSPLDGDSASTPVTLDWQTPYDPDFGDQVRYDLYVSTLPSFDPDSTTVYEDLGMSQLTESLDDRIDCYWKVRAYDNWGAERWSTETWGFFTYICGDVNVDSVVNVGDIIYLLAYLYENGPAPAPPYRSGDVNCDGRINVGDIIFLVSYLYKGGPAPHCEDCKNGETFCSFRSASERASLGRVGFGNLPSLSGGIVELPITCEFSTEIAAVDLEISYDYEKIEVLSADVADMAEGLQIYYCPKDQLLKIGIVDIYGEHSIQPGEGTLMALRVKGTDLSSLEISNVILVDEHGNMFEPNVTEKLETSPSSRPAEFSLAQNYPNPFNPETQISYALPEKCQVKLSVYNVRGQRVRVLVDEFQAAGHQTVLWDGKNEDGQAVASGIYFYRLEAEAFSDTKSMVLLK